MGRPAEAQAARPLFTTSLLRRISLRPETVLFGMAALWAAVPLCVVLGRVVLGDETATGAYGMVPIDQLQYLAWVRQAGEGLLISNLFTVEDSAAVFLHPIYLTSGLLWKAGVPLELAFPLWTPVAVFVLLYGVNSYVRRFLDSGGPRLAALAMALFLGPPLLPLLDVLGPTLDLRQVELLRAFGYELNSATFLWAYLPKAIAVGLMAISFLAAARAVAASGRKRLVSLAAAAAGALLVSWLHPWQGVTMALVLTAVVVWYRFDRSKLPLLAVAGLGSLPLLYYFVLSRTNDDWATASTDLWPTPSLTMWVVAAVGLSPLIYLAIRGAKRPFRGVQEKILVLWPLAALATLAVPSAGWFYAPAGASIPLSILIVRGWGSLCMPAWARSARARRILAACLVAAVTVPAPIFVLQRYSEQLGSNWFRYYSEPSEEQALEFLRQYPEPGAVLTSPRYGAVTAVQTGRKVWNGHPQWTPGFEARDSLSLKVLAGSVGKDEARAVLQGSGARFLLTDCRYPPEFVARNLRGVVQPLRNFGCAAVYRIPPR